MIMNRNYKSEYKFIVNINVFFVDLFCLIDISVFITLCCIFLIRGKFSSIIIPIIFLSVCSVGFIYCLISAIKESKKQFVINENECVLRKGKNIVFSTPIQEVTSIVLIKMGRTKFIMIDDKNHPYTMREGLHVDLTMGIGMFYYKSRLEKICFFCPACPIINDDFEL